MLVGAGSLVAAFTVLHLVRAIPHWSQLNYVSGVWLGLAADASQGIWYRPIVSDLGYGGAIYLPAYFAGVAALVRLGLPPIAAGFAVSLAAGALLCVGVYFFLRQYAGGALSLSGALLSLGAIPVQHALVTTRGDLLGTAFTFAGLALFPRVLPMAAFFALAFSAKITAVYGMLAVTAFFLAARRWREAAQLAAATAAGYALVILVSAYLSDGRILEGLFSFGYKEFDSAVLLASPMLTYKMIRQDATLAPLLVLAVAVSLVSLRDSLRELTSLLLACTLLVTVVIFAMPGTDYNHLIDLYVATVVLLIAHLAASRIELRHGVAFLTLMALLATTEMAWHFKLWTPTDQKSLLQHLERTVSPSIAKDRPLLSTNPMLPVMRGELPFMADPFSFAALRHAYPDLEIDLHRRLAGRQFGAIVLHWNVSLPGGRAKADAWFGEGFTDTLYRHYEPIPEPSDHSVFVPRRR